MDLNYFCNVEELFRCSDMPVAKAVEEVCDSCLWSLITPEAGRGGIFGFAEFVQAFALLVLIYTFTGARYHFRIATAPIPLPRMVFVLSGVIGLASLITDLWFAQQFSIPVILSNQRYWQFVLGLVFLWLILVWLWYAYVRPPKFGKRNALTFTRAVYRAVLQGNNDDLPAIADELERSAEKIVKFAGMFAGEMKQQSHARYTAGRYSTLASSK